MGSIRSALNVWKDFQAFAIGLGRWLLGGDPPATVQASIERQGGQGHRAWVRDDTLEARFPLQNAGLYLGAVLDAGEG
jgi:hypothetical protein